MELKVKVANFVDFPYENEKRLQDPLQYPERTQKGISGVLLFCSQKKRHRRV